MFSEVFYEDLFDVACGGLDGLVLAWRSEVLQLRADPLRLNV